MTISIADLQAFVGKNIGAICSNGFDSAAQNHCAHFVSHALGIGLGMKCGDMTFKTKGTGASIRCDELYNRLSRRGAIDKTTTLADGTLVFVLSARNVRANMMANVPQKHVGIYHSNKVFNFSNSQHQVVADSLDRFHAKFKSIYAGGDVSLFYAVVPQSA